jgi:aspartate racemase
VKTLGIVAHSAEGAGLCFVTACRYGGEKMGEFNHPDIVMSAIPMSASIPGWMSNDFDEVGRHLAKGVQMVADAGADFWICPDNTAHLVFEGIADDLPIPGLHIADVVCGEIVRNGWKKVGLLGTKWTMNGSVYERALGERGLERLIPDEAGRQRVDDAIFDELCLGVISKEVIGMFEREALGLRDRGADCVIAGCTEIPLVLTNENSPIPVVDSTRLLARRAVDLCLDEREMAIKDGWVVLD